MSKSIGVNVVKLLSSRVAAQALSFISAPIIARLYSPGDFGITQIFISITSVIVVITGLRYELSIPLGKDESEASASFILSLFFTLIFTLLVLAIVPVAKEKIAHWYKAPELKTFLWLLPIYVFAGGLRNSLGYYAAREGRFGAMAWSGFGSSLSDKFVTIAWALIIGASVTGLFVGGFSGTTISILLLFMFLRRKLVSDIKNADINFEMLWMVAKRHKKFPIFSTWSILLNTISIQLPPIILGLYFSTAVVGYYSLGQRLVSLPTVLLVSSIAQVFFPTAAKEYNETGTLSEIVSNMFRRLVQIGIFPMAALGFWGAMLFGFIFGQKWIEAGIYVQILSVWLLINFMASPLSSVFSILNRQQTPLIFNVVTISGRLLGLILGATFDSPRLALALYSGFSVIIRCVFLSRILHYSNVSLRWAAMLMFKYIILSCLLLLPVGCISWFFSNTLLALGGLILATFTYIWILFRIEPAIRNWFADTKKKQLC